MSNKIINRTTVDNAGERLGLYRESNESLENFQSRITRARKEVSRHKYSFRESLDYITKERNVYLFEVQRINGSPLQINFDGVFLYIDNERININTVKFIKDLKSHLEQKGFLTSGYLTEDTEYLQTKNVLPFSSKRLRVNRGLEKSRLTSLNEVAPSKILDSLGVYKSEDQQNISWDRRDVLEGWHVSGKDLYKENSADDTVSYEYEDFPLIIKWSKFKYYFLNEDSFDYRIKKLAKVKKSDSEETPYILTQEGAKLLNKLYKISNTYWGK
jgi:hypothetical protein